jgi:hypothetical protein
MAGRQVAAERRLPMEVPAFALNLKRAFVATKCFRDIPARVMTYAEVIEGNGLEFEVSQGFIDLTCTLEELYGLNRVLLGMKT